MATVGPSRNSIVAMAFEGLRKDERRMKRIATITKAKPDVAAPAPAAKKAAKKPARKKGARK